MLVYMGRGKKFRTITPPPPESEDEDPFPASSKSSDAEGAFARSNADRDLPDFCKKVTFPDVGHLLPPLHGREDFAVDRRLECVVLSPGKIAGS